MPQPHANAWVFIGAAFIGAVSAAGILLVEYLARERRQHRISRDVNSLNQQLNSMREELQQLRALQEEKNKNDNNRSMRSRRSKSNSLSTTDYDSSDLEFYDLSDEEVLQRTSEPDFSYVDQYLDSGNCDKLRNCISILLDFKEDYKNCPELLWRLGKAHSNIATLTEDVNEKKENISKGLKFCEEALRINSDNVNAHKWYAILIGSRGDFQTTKEKIADGFEFKKHIDIAIGLNPKDPSLYHLLGRFSYEVAALKWYEKKIASTLFGEPPSSTYEEALSYFKKAEDLSIDDWKENKLLVGKCYFAMGDVASGVYWLKEASNVATKNEMEEQIDQEIQSLLVKYR